jgi:ABC-type Mn2+/Zn2+ transport systems, permease components
MDDFLLRSLLMGVGFSILAGPLGSVMVWRRLSFLGDTVAHSALLGLGFSLLFNVASTVMLTIVCVVFAIALIFMPLRSKVSLDAVLAILSHGSLALGLVVLGLLKQSTLMLSGFLFGDILAVTPAEVIGTFALAGVMIVLLACFWRPFLTTLISEDLATADQVQIVWVKLAYAVTLGLAVGLLLKTIGVLLMTALLIIPATAARYIAQSPLQMMIISSCLAIVSYGFGFWGSYLWDTPTAPSVVVMALGLVLVLRLYKWLYALRKR